MTKDNNVTLPIIARGDRVILRRWLESDVDFFIYTLSHGEWRFFSAPWCGYRTTTTAEQEKKEYQFHDKPLLIGGMAMEYYGLRKTGADIDLVVSAYDHVRLKQQYPLHIKDLYGDIGICEFEFEIWNQICRFNYEELKVGAIEEAAVLIISLERLLFLKTLAIREEKYYQDVLLLVDEILKRKYA